MAQAQRVAVPGRRKATVAAALNKGFKTQPWMLYDTVAARSFLAGDVSADGLAIGSQTPAISAQGELFFFDQGRTLNSPGPWYCNLQTNGQVPYGMDVWAMGLEIMVPLTQAQTTTTGLAVTDPTHFVNSFPQGAKLIECILEESELELNLGQEQQLQFPTSRIPAGAGLANVSFLQNKPSSGELTRHNVLPLPEPIQMPRTQPLSAKIRLSPAALAMIGNPTTHGVGCKLPTISFTCPGDEQPVTLVQLPFKVRLTLIGKRIKKQQYGQVYQGEGAAA